MRKAVGEALGSSLPSVHGAPRPPEEEGLLSSSLTASALLLESQSPYLRANTSNSCGTGGLISASQHSFFKTPRTQAVNKSRRSLSFLGSTSTPPSYFLAEWSLRGCCEGQVSFGYLIAKAKSHYQLLTFSIDF